MCNSVKSLNYTVRMQKGNLQWDKTRSLNFFDLWVLCENSQKTHF